MPTITIGETNIDYAVERRARRKHPAIHISSDQKVTVLVPEKFDLDAIEVLLHGKAQWLLKHLNQSVPLPTLPLKEFVSGEGFLLLGRLYQLQVTSQSKITPQVMVDGRHIRVVIPMTLVPQQHPVIVREILVQWYLAEAKQLLSERIDHYVPIVGVAPTRLKIAEYKSRWGFCREDGLIALNWRILQAPPSVIDYVVVHELTHRFHLHHRQSFWDALSRVLPDYAMRKQWLRDHGAELSW